MKKQIQKRAALLAAAFLFGAAALAAPQTAVLADEAAATEEATDNVKASPVLIVEGNTIYVDATSDGPWNSMQGTIKFDSSVEVEDYGVETDFTVAASEQEAMGFPAQNVTDDGEFIFAAAYTTNDGAGVEYDGHIFYITFKDTTTPIDVTVYDEYSYELYTATVDGAEEAVTYAPDEAVIAENAEKHDAEVAANAADTSTDTDADTDTDTASSTEEAAKTGTSSRNVVPIIVVIVVVVLAAVTIVIAKKNKTSGQAVSDSEKTTDADK